MPTVATRTVRLDGPFDLARTLRPIRRGPADPCMRLWADECWRASRNPAGAATMHLQRLGGAVEVQAWGPGAGWAIEHVPELLGVHDEPEAFQSRIPLLHDLVRRFPGVRIGRTGAVAEALAPTVIEQKVTGTDAHRAWTFLVRRLGEPAPGPAPLLVPPSPATLAATPSWVFHRANVERKRAHTITRAMARACRLEETTAMPMADAYVRLQAFPGIGPWSAAEVAHVALGDTDAVSVGDFHLKNQVAWALAGEERGTDERMVELLEPWRGQRARVLRLLALAGVQAPRRGARLPTRSIAAL